MTEEENEKEQEQSIPYNFRIPVKVKEIMDKMMEKKGEKSKFIIEQIEKGLKSLLSNDNICLHCIIAEICKERPNCGKTRCKHAILSTRSLKCRDCEIWDDRASACALISITGQLKPERNGPCLVSAFTPLNSYRFDLDYVEKWKELKRKMKLKKQVFDAGEPREIPEDDGESINEEDVKKLDDIESNLLGGDGSG